MFLTIHIQSRLQKYDCVVWVMSFPDIDKAGTVVNETAKMRMIYPVHE